MLLLYQFPWKEWSIFTLKFPCPLSLKIIPARLSSSQLTANVVLGVTSSPGFPAGSAAKNLPAKQEPQDPWVKKIPWRSTWQPTPIFSPGESHGQRSLVGYRPRGHKELDTTEETARAHTHTHTHTVSSPLIDRSSGYFLVFTWLDFSSL